MEEAVPWLTGWLGFSEFVYRSLLPREPDRSWLDATGAPLGVQQKLLRHANISTTMQCGNSLMESKRGANSKAVQMARPLLQRA